MKLVPSLRIVANRPLFRQLQETIDDLGISLEGIDKDKCQRHEPKERKKQREDKNELRKNRVFHISTSHFFRIRNRVTVMQSTSTTKINDFAVASP